MLENEKTLFVHSLGCPKNYADSEGAAGSFIRKGYKLTAGYRDASVVLVNTCAFIKDARDEAAEWIDYYSRNKAACGYKLVVFGCFVEYLKSEIKSRFPEVDLFAGSNRIGDMQKALCRSSGGFLAGGEAFFWRPRYRLAVHKGLPYRYLKISEGCDRKCSFCEIPAIRGRFKSNTARNIRAEARELVGSGAKELVIVSQDTSAYGKDLKTGDNLIQLINTISKIDGLEFLRLLYLYPDCVSSRLIGEVRDNPKVCAYFDMPIQHISDKILKKMNRASRKAKIVKTIEKIKHEIPNASIRTSLITGFPGESEKDFQELLSFVREGWFDHLGVFAYSEVEKLKGLKKPSAEEAQQRLKRIYGAQRDVVKSKLKSLVGTRQKTLIDQQASLGCAGRSYYQAPEIDGHIVFEQKIPSGNVREALITGYNGYNLKGKFL